VKWLIHQVSVLMARWGRWRGAAKVCCTLDANKSRAFFVVVLDLVSLCWLLRLHQRTFILFRSQDGAWSVYPYRVAGASAGAVRRGSQHTPPGKNIRNFVALIIREFDCFWYVRLLSRTNYQNQCTYVWHSNSLFYVTQLFVYSIAVSLPQRRHSRSERFEPRSTVRLAIKPRKRRR